MAELLSDRARQNVRGVDRHWNDAVDAFSNPWSPTNIGGLILLGPAENRLMRTALDAHIEAEFNIDRASHLTYGQQSQGSLRLRRAVAGLFNDRFVPTQPTSSDEIVITSGITAAIDHLTWCICNEGEGLLVPQPMCTGYRNSIPTRSKGRLLPVSFAREDGSVNLSDVFDPPVNTICFERAYREFEQRGVKIKGVMITSPHNPLGKCYSKEAIVAVIRFCAKYKLHYISDEIYALSVFRNAEYPDATPFSSVLSIDTADIIDANLVHVLYGAAKDWCANGLRLGVVHTRNDNLREAISSITTFAWPAYIVQDSWARLLEDKDYASWFITTNQQRLAAHYHMLTEFLDRHGICYFRGGNAGVFLWIDLRLWLQPDDLTKLRPSSPKFEVNLQKEDRLWAYCLRRGVIIAMGTSSLSQEVGWIRIVFTVEEQALRAGLERFLVALKEWETAEWARKRWVIDLDQGTQSLETLLERT